MIVLKTSESKHGAVYLYHTFFVLLFKYVWKIPVVRIQASASAPHHQDYVKNFHVYRVFWNMSSGKTPAI